jgi:hypothetical protein
MPSGINCPSEVTGNAGNAVFMMATNPVALKGRNQMKYT